MKVTEINKPIKEYRNVVTPRDEAHYRELMKTLHNLELKSASDPATMAEIKRRKMELRNWAEQNLKTEDAGDMVHIKKGDKEYTVPNSDIEKYKSQGFEIVAPVTVSPEQMSAYRKWYDKWNKLDTVGGERNYADGIFYAYMDAGTTDLDAVSKQDPNKEAFDELERIFGSNNIEAIGYAIDKAENLGHESTEESGVTPGGTKVDYANMMFRGKEIDHNSIEYEMQDASDMIFQLLGAKYIDGTDLNDQELEELEATDELQDWVRIDHATSGPEAPDDYQVGEGFIGKKPEYNDFLQNKLDQAIQEFDTPEKKAERDALMKHYLAKGGTVEKVPAGQKAFVGKKIKPAYKKDNGTPTTSPGSDESAVKEEAPFGSGMDLIRMAVQRKFISAEEYMNYAKELKAAGEEVANGPHYADWPDGEGFGSSDGNFAIKQMMDTAGYEFDEQDRTGRFVVTKMPEKLAKLGITNVRMRKEPVATEDTDKYAPARVLGAAEAGLEYGLELATHVGKKEYGMAEQVASVIRQNWPALIDKIKNVYKTTEDDSETANGLQPVDLKRLGQTEPKVYVHKDGKTILIPKRKHNEYLAKGWKQSSLRAETESYDSKLTAMLDQRLK